MNFHEEFPKQYIECNDNISNYLPKLNNVLGKVSGAHVFHIFPGTFSLCNTLSMDKVSIPDLL